MKRTGLILLLLVVSMNSFTQRFEWKVKFSAPKSVVFYDIKFFNSMVGIAVGNNDTNNYIMLTTDGGETWTNKANTAVTEMMKGAEFIDANTTYIIGRKGALYKTINQGDFWSKINLGTNANLNDISFPSANKAYLCSDAGRYLYYDGIGWTTITVYAKDNYINVKFPNVNEGILVASNGRIWKTINGGAKWDTIKRNLEQISGSHFLTTNLGYIVGPKGMIKRTIDGGNKWSDTLIYPKNYRTINFQSIYFVSQNFGFAGGSDGIILRTADGGSNWAKEDVQTNSTIMKMYCVNNLLGFAVSNNGMILKRYDVTSMNENLSPSLLIYPNPVLNKLFIKSFNNLEEYKVSITDITGKCVKNMEIQNPANGIDAEELLPGIYFLTIRNSNEIYNYKFIKK